VVGVRVRQRDSHDRLLQPASGGEDGAVHATQAGVDHSQAVVLLDQVGIDDAQPGDAGDRHRDLQSERVMSVISRSKLNSTSNA